MQTICRITGKPFVVSPMEEEYCQKNGIPLPTVHPYERLRNLLIFRNRPYLYNTICDYSKKEVLTCIPPEKGIKVYDNDIWHSDVWDPLSYGKSYDFQRPFFDQFFELSRNIPWPNLSIVSSINENSDYTNGITGAKNCYLVFSSSYNEDCMFCRSLWNSKNLIDCVYAHESELCYSCSHIKNCFNVSYSENAYHCSDSWFLYNCQNCQNCFGCVNMNNKQFCFFNEQLTKDAYIEKMKIVVQDLGSCDLLQKMKKVFQNFKNRFPVKYYQGKNNENSTGNFLNNTKNCKGCLMTSNAEDVEYAVQVDKVKTSFLYAAYGNNAELIYNTHSTGDNVYNIKFCNECWQGAHDLEYCMFTSYGANNCFGCMGLTKKSYCILNKQYTKEEYEELLPRIKKHMMETGEYGNFFPPSFSPFYYNQSEVNDYFPSTKEEVVSRGYDWKDEVKEITTGSYQIPDNIRDVKDDILDALLVCERTGKKYKIIKQELAYYREHHIPIPRVAPLERIKMHSTIFQMGVSRDVACAQCGAMVQTMYPEIQQKIYCEKCYVNEVF